MIGSFLRSRAIAASRTIPRHASLQSTYTISSRHTARTSQLQLTTVRTLSTSYPRVQQAQAASATEDEQTVLPTDSDVSAQTFQQLADKKHVHSNLLRAVMGDMGLTTMYPVQQETMNAALTGRDVIAQARTGTGKTLAFLLPIMQHILQEDPQLAYRGRRRARPDDIRGIIISPTRELAEQIAQEALKIARYTGIIVQLGVGGTQKNMMLRKAQHEGCHLLVGTPGRLKDLLSDPHTGMAAPKLTTFVLDEADRLLDAGFTPEIEGIKQLLPDLKADNRQTMMMSATISHEVVDLVRNTLEPGFKYVQCVDPNEAPTHDRIPQKVVVTPGMENGLPALYELLQREVQAWQKGETDRPLKALVFFNSGYETILAHRVFSALTRSDSDFRQTRFDQIHSKLTQAARTNTSERFRRSVSGVLFSTDVTARGLDFPDVTHVIQVGIPAHGGRESYIHRLGRTGRAGKEGEGWLIIPRLEQSKGEQILGDLPLKPDTSLKAAQARLTEAGEQPAEVAEIMTKLRSACSVAPAEDFDNAYRAYLGAMGAYPSQAVVDNINRMATITWGLEEPPAVSQSTASKLGYSRCHGIKIQTFDRNMGDQGAYGGGSSRGSYGGGGGSSRGSYGGGGWSSDGGNSGFGGSSGRSGYGGSSGRSGYGGSSGRSGFGGSSGRSGYGGDRGRGNSYRGSGRGRGGLDFGSDRGRNGSRGGYGGGYGGGDRNVDRLTQMSS